MNLNQPTLIQFENERKKNNYIPPMGSNSFYTIGDGVINLFVVRNDVNDYLFDMYTDSGHVYTGAGSFQFNGDTHDCNYPYRNLTIIQDTTLSVTTALTFAHCEVEIYGSLELLESAVLYVRDGAHVIFYTDAELSLTKSSNIIVDDKSSVEIYGHISTHISKVESITGNDNIMVDSACVITVNGIDKSDRPATIKDYEDELREKIINEYTQGQKILDTGRINYVWKKGDPMSCSQVLQLSLISGEVPLGDFKFSLLGIPNHLISNLQTISSLIIDNNTTLYISDKYEGYTYYNPELYIGIIIDNTDVVGSCIVNGTIVVDGEQSKITIDRGATLYINQGAHVYLRNGGSIQCTHNETNDRVLFINGTLELDNIEQISSFGHDNIVIGETGRIIILNPDTGKKKILFSTPNGIHNTDLYRLFRDRIEHVTYHISKNNGIKIDQYYEYYSRQMTKWYADMRLEKAIHEQLIIWHDGAFIELNNEIIPWVNENCTLLDIGKMFKTYGTTDQEKLQEAVDLLTFAGSGNILFRFNTANNVKEIELKLNKSPITVASYNPLLDIYYVETKNNGTLFMQNEVYNISFDKLVSTTSTQYRIIDNTTKFIL